MRKRDELNDPKSRLNMAADNEPLFVLLGRDPAACVAVQHWIWARIRLGLNKSTDAKILGASEWIAMALDENDHAEQPIAEAPDDADEIDPLDYFAAAAMNGLLARRQEEFHCDKAAQFAYDQAEAMMAERSKRRAATITNGEDDS